MNTPESGLDERYYCPYPGCKRSFAELWRLKVHYRAPPDIRGSGKERGHGTELTHCPKCGKALKPGKHHVGCSGGKAAPRQAKRARLAAQAASACGLQQDGLNGDLQGMFGAGMMMQGGYSVLPPAAAAPANGYQPLSGMYTQQQYPAYSQSYSSEYSTGPLQQLPGQPQQQTTAGYMPQQQVQPLHMQAQQQPQQYGATMGPSPFNQPVLQPSNSITTSGSSLPSPVVNSSNGMQLSHAGSGEVGAVTSMHGYPYHQQSVHLPQQQLQQQQPAQQMQVSQPMQQPIMHSPQQQQQTMMQPMQGPDEQLQTYSLGATQQQLQPMAMQQPSQQPQWTSHPQMVQVPMQQQPQLQQPPLQQPQAMPLQQQGYVPIIPVLQSVPNGIISSPQQQQQSMPVQLPVQNQGYKGIQDAAAAGLMPPPPPVPMQQLQQQQQQPIMPPAVVKYEQQQQLQLQAMQPGNGTILLPQQQMVATASKNQLSGAISSTMFDEIDNPSPTTAGDEVVSAGGLGRVPSPPPLPADFPHAGCAGTLFNFSQFSVKLPAAGGPSRQMAMLPKGMEAELPTSMDDLWTPEATYDHHSDGDLMQLLFGAPEQPPTMATIHLHHFLEDDACSPLLSGLLGDSADGLHANGEEATSGAAACAADGTGAGAAAVMKRHSDSGAGNAGVKPEMNGSAGSGHTYGPVSAPMQQPQQPQQGHMVSNQLVAPGACMQPQQQQQQQLPVGQYYSGQLGSKMSIKQEFPAAGAFSSQQQQGHQSVLIMAGKQAFMTPGMIANGPVNGQMMNGPVANGLVYTVPTVHVQQQPGGVVNVHLKAEDSNCLMKPAAAVSTMPEAVASQAT